MYDLLTDMAHASLSRDQFRARYMKALNEATVTSVQTELLSLLHDGVQAQADFRARWQTNRFGALDFDNTMTLLWEGGRWGVAWSSTLVLPQLGDDLSLVLLPDQISERGHIYDQNGLGLAVDGQRVIIGMVPGWLQDEATAVTRVSAITGVSPEIIRSKLAAAQPDWFVPIADVSPEVSVNNNDILSSLAGVSRREHTVRNYKEGDLAAHLVGYLGVIPPDEQEDWQLKGYQGDEWVGRAGVEAWGESYLAGKRGGRLVTLNRQNEEVAQVAQVEAQPGSSIYVTIDKTLQAEAERILGQRLGAIVVLEPDTGFVLAMASYPRFDPNFFVTGIDQEAWTALNADPNRPFVNRGVLGTYPPGSVFKIVTMVAGMEKLGLTADTPFFCTGTWDGLGDQFIKTCWLKTGHGRINLQDGLTQSCDSVFYDVGLALQNADPQILPEMTRAFGLGRVSGITGIAESPGLVPDPAWKLKELGESWFSGDSVNLAIGQGYLLTTPLQIANMLAAVGNGGTLYRPQLIRRISNPTGSDQFSRPEVLASLPVSSEQLVVIRKGLEGVVSNLRGTARKVFEGATFTAAGKTGTAESGQEEPHAWFAGYAPADSPQVAIAVVVEHVGEGSKEAAPLFRQMAEAYFARQAELAPLDEFETKIIDRR